MCGAFFDAPQNRARLKTLEARAADPNFWSNQEEAQSVLRDRKKVEDQLAAQRPISKVSVADLAERAGITKVSVRIHLELDVVDADTAAETVALAEADGLDIASMAPVDLADPVAARRWVEAGVRVHGRIDVVYNNASRPAIAPFPEISLEEYRYTVANEIDLVWHVCQASWVIWLPARESSSIRRRSPA